MTCPKGHDVILASNDIADFIPSDDELVEGFGLSLINLFATVFIEWCPVCEKLVSIWVDTPEQEMQTQAAPAATVTDTYNELDELIGVLERAHIEDGWIQVAPQFVAKMRSALAAVRGAGGEEVA